MRPQIVKYILTSALSLLSSAVMLAQQLSSDTGPPPPGNGSAQRGPELPIDNGILFLVLAGLIYGIYIITTAKKVKSRES